MIRHADDLPPWIWLWPVLLLLILQFTARAVIQDHAVYVSIFETESGLVELLTALLLFPTAWLALATARFFWTREGRIEAAFLVGFALFCILLLGEEVSWGQHVFQWESPAYFLEHNKQSETNLHNMSYVNKKLLKFLVILGIGIGGILVPILARLKPGWLRSEAGRLVRMLPTHVCMPAAIVVVISHVSVKILLKGYGIESAWDLIGVSVRELTELYITVFFLIYALSLYWRTVYRRDPSRESPAPA